LGVKRSPATSGSHHTNLPAPSNQSRLRLSHGSTSHWGVRCPSQQTVKAEKPFTAKRLTRALYGAGRVRRTQPFSGCLGGCQRALVRSKIASLAFGTTTLAPFLFLKPCHSHGNRQLLRQCFGNVRRHDELHRDGFWSHLRERDRGSQDHEKRPRWLPRSRVSREIRAALSPSTRLKK
jgi:hypothetical protein